MTYKEKNDKLVAALKFYADPDSYFAIAFFPDRPCGDFMLDFSDDHGFNEYDRLMPGKLARATLLELGEDIYGQANGDVRPYILSVKEV